MLVYIYMYFSHLFKVNLLNRLIYQQPLKKKKLAVTHLYNGIRAINQFLILAYRNCLIIDLAP